MRERYLEVTYRKGRPIAAYLYLPRQVGAKSSRTESVGPGTLVDYDEAGEPIGIELTAPLTVGVAQINAVLDKLGLQKVSDEELAPLRAA